MTIAEECKFRIDKQSEKGLTKYGHLLDSAGLNYVELVEHAIQETTDNLQYLVALKRSLMAARLSAVYSVVGEEINKEKK